LFKKKRFAWLAVLLAFGLVAAACGDDDDTGSGDGGSDDAAASGDCPADVEGDIVVSGSSTVEPISTAVGEKLLDCSGIAATVDGPGTGDGFELFCAGETDISDASRPISEEEVAACEDAGIDFVELKIAFDGISVLTNPANDGVECLNFADLYALFGPEAEGVDSWSGAQALATELGSATELPDADLTITAPGAESGTYDSFNEIVFGDISEARAEAGKITEDQIETSRPDYASQADDTAIIAAMEAEDTPFGFVGFAFAEEAGDQVKEITVAPEAGTDCVEPSAETIADGSYPISRSLYIYVNAANAEENPAVAGFVDFFLSDEGIASVNEVGYVDLPDDQLQAARDAWEARTVGTTAE
jgi:phosphate transport system substrate-binding protein